MEKAQQAVRIILLLLKRHIISASARMMISLQFEDEGVVPAFSNSHFAIGYNAALRGWRTRLAPKDHRKKQHA